MRASCRRRLLSGGLLAGAGLLSVLLASLPLATPGAAMSAEARIGAAAPNFTLTDSNGRPVSLAEFKGKTIVLEWSPYVRKHYGGNNMQALQKKWTAQGVVWLTLISSQPGSQGFVHGLEANKLTDDRGAAPTAVLLDPNGNVGRSYGAQVTPHMYVIGSDGVLRYMGGIDDKPTTRLEDLRTAKNFVDAALNELFAGKPVSIKTSRPYGCTIKYSS